MIVLNTNRHCDLALASHSVARMSSDIPRRMGLSIDMHLGALKTIILKKQKKMTERVPQLHFDFALTIDD